jgi:quercetin dioxygenase-like cupin family protein
MSKKLLVLAALVAAFAGGALVRGAAPPQRIDLAAVNNPLGGHGRTLALTKVIIPAGSGIPLHRHPGTGVAYIDSGTLTYTVKKGHVDVHEGPPGVDSKVVTRISAGHTGTIHAGQWIVEQPSVIHMAQNKTGKAIVIHLATLYPIGAAPSIPVTG